MNDERTIVKALEHEVHDNALLSKAHHHPQKTWFVLPDDDLSAEVVSCGIDT